MNESLVQPLDYAPQVAFREVSQRHPFPPCTLCPNPGEEKELFLELRKENNMDPNLDGIGCLIIGAIIAAIAVAIMGEKSDESD